MTEKILFVCTGNTCRSSMAEHLFRRLAEELGRQEFVVRSAGVAAMQDDPASYGAVEVLRGKGIDTIMTHRATPVYDELVKEADLILTMTCSHKETLLQRYPGASEKIFTLKEYTRRAEEYTDEHYTLDIHDPYGQPVEVYAVCAAELEVHLKRLFDIL